MPSLCQRPVRQPNFQSSISMANIHSLARMFTITRNRLPFSSLEKQTGRYLTLLTQPNRVYRTLWRIREWACACGLPVSLHCCFNKPSWNLIFRGPKETKATKASPWVNTYYTNLFIPVNGGGRDGFAWAARRTLGVDSLGFRAVSSVAVRTAQNSKTSGCVNGFCFFRSFGK